MKIKFVNRLKKRVKYYLRVSLIKLCEKYGVDEEYFIEKYNDKFPKVKTVLQTIDELVNTNKSIVRFGDGELEIIEGRSIPFQKKSDILSVKLKEVLSSSNNNILVAIPHFIYSNKDNLQEIPKIFWRTNGRKFRETIAKYINANEIYYAAEFTISNDAYKNFDVSKYFRDLQKIWDNKNITLICGETVFDKIEHNIFSNAKSIEYLYAPSLDAFYKYDEILKSALVTDKSRIVIIILGPTAKVLAYDLALKGYRTLDLGHIAKSYDWHCKGKNTIQMKDAVEFFSPD